MSIKFKLLLSYAAMIFIPLFLTAISAAVIFGFLYEDTVRHGSGRELFSSMAQKVYGYYMELERTVVYNPEKLNDKDYLSEMDRKFEAQNLGLVILRQDGTVVYTSKLLKDTGVVEELLKTEDPYGMHDTDNNNAYATLFYQKLELKDKSSIKVYMLANFKPVSIFLGRYFSTLGLTILIILLVTNVGLTVLVSRSIIKPLRLLKYGTDQIKEGNLNFEIKVKKRDEIGDVLRAFEQMRSRLKASIDTQIQFEENRKELISSISHDLKTPVTSIKGYVEGIMDGVADTPDKMDRYIRTIYSKANDLDRLIDDLFLFSKLDLKKVPFNFEKVDLAAYFKDCSEELRVDLEKHGVSLKFINASTDGVFVMADREKLKRVIVNIVENAVKYMDKEEKAINIRLSSEGDTATVEIQDNGQGIREEELPFIFDRFYRTDASRNSSTGGSGLGLSIARQIIEGHEGKIWAESVYGGKTTISFTLKRIQRG